MVRPAEAVLRGREAYGEGRWNEAYQALLSADASKALAAPDLELVATAAYMLGRTEEYLRVLERAYRAHLDGGHVVAAIRDAFWIGVHLAQRGEMGGAGGWLGRAQRLLERDGSDRPESGYLLLPRVFQQEAERDLEGAAATAAEAAAIGERFDDLDLFALAAHEHGHLLIRTGRISDGLRLLDEAMIAVTRGELSPIVCGIVYCGAILACQDAHDIGRAREWTAALTAWCDGQPDLVAFSGRCLVHRAQLLQRQGRWSDALEEADRAVDRCLAGENPAAAGEACYQSGEVQRLRGDFAAAEQAYREASRHGFEPQPGLALMRLAAGEPEAARAAIERIRAEASEPPQLARILPAYVEILLAADALDSAREAAAELERLAEGEHGNALEATAAQARGAVDLAAGDPSRALPSLRTAAEIWQQFDCVYEIARVRELRGRACRELGDEESARLELEAAVEAYTRLGAAHDLARAELLLELTPAAEQHGLTGRELEVLRLIAAGKTNREIAAELVISEHTVARHVQNIFAKLELRSRTAASAFAFEHHLV